MSKALAKADEAQLPAELAAQFEADAGAGNENVRQEDLVVPFLKILQKMSPELDKRAPEYIQGAEEGMIMNNATGELWTETEGVTVVTCAFNRTTLEWKLREQGGGLVARWDRDDPNKPAVAMKDEKGRDITNTGTQLVDVLEHFVLTLDENGMPSGGALVSMSSTQLKYGRKWNNLVVNAKIPGTAKQLPRYGQKFKLTTVGESNDQGSWCSWKVTADGIVTDPVVYQAAKEFHQLVSSEEAVVRYPEEETQNVM